MAKNGLIYSDKTRVLPGVPGRDLTHDEVERYGGYNLLLSSGLYTAVEPPKKSTKKAR